MNTPIESGVLSPQRERIESLDAIRGFALLGVLLVNLHFFSGQQHMEWGHGEAILGRGGAALVFVRDLFLLNKSMYLFSLLFGVGISMQAERAEISGTRFMVFGLRRMAALFLIGSFHTILVWDGDVLMTYAVVGLIILAARKQPIKRLAWLVALSLPIAVEIAYNWRPLSKYELTQALSIGYWKTTDWPDKATLVLGHGSWLQAMRYRVWESIHIFLGIRIYNTLVLIPVFLLGQIIWRSRLVQDADAKTGTIRILFHATFWVGLGYTLLDMVFIPKLDPKIWATFPGYLLNILGEASIAISAISYLSGFLLLKKGNHLHTLLAPMGRMALTNYLAMSVVATLIFNGYGFGLWQKVSAASYLIGGLVFYAVLIAHSHWWFSRFKFGPVEWLWRWLTYGAAPPFRRTELLYTSKAH